MEWRARQYWRMAMEGIVFRPKVREGLGSRCERVAVSESGSSLTRRAEGLHYIVFMGVSSPYLTFLIYPLNCNSI
jgi:hypothetical protein